MNTNTTLPGLNFIGQIAVPVQDPDRAAAFYRDRLGMKFLFRAGGLVFFDAGGVRLMLSKPESPEFERPGSVIYYKADDIHAMYAALKARGVPFEGEPHLITDMGDHELWMAFFRDSEGNLLGIMGEIYKS